MEIETKVILTRASWDNLLGHLEREATENQPAHLEKNWLLDDARGTLKKENRVLRIRESQGLHNLLTVKGPSHIQGSVRSREEKEAKIHSASSTLAALSLLGYKPSFYYEKYRQCWTEILNGESGEICLDRTPAGLFAELEGSAEWIRDCKKTLKLSRRSCSAETYYEIWQNWSSQHPGVDPRAMRF